MVRTPAQALAQIRALAAAKTDIGTGACQANAHNVYGIASDGTPSAADAYARAKYKHALPAKPTKKQLKAIPVGAFFFFGGGHTIVKSTGKPAGHIALWAGFHLGVPMVWSPGAPGTGCANRWVLVPMDSIMTGWPGHFILGWTEDIDGVRVAGLAPVKPGAHKATKAKALRAPVVNGVARTDIIDGSHYITAALNFAQLKAAGVKGIIWKATEGTSYVDPTYTSHRAQVKAAGGFAWGAFHFARPSQSNGTVQAKHYCTVANLKAGDMVAILDLEDRGGLSDAALDTWVTQWVKEVKKQTGAKLVIIYTRFRLSSKFKKYPLWVPRYSNAMTAPVLPAPYSAWTMWQFSDGTYGHPNSVPGVGHCDISVLAGNDPAKTLATLVIPKKSTAAKSIVAAAVTAAAAAGAGHATAPVKTPDPVVQQAPSPAKTTTKAPVKPAPAPKTYGNADAVLTAAKAGVKATKPGKRHDVFVQIRKLIKPYVSK